MAKMLWVCCFFKNENSRFWHLVPFWETLSRHWNFLQHKETKISSTQTVVKDLICVIGNMNLFMFLLEPENLEIWTGVSRITEHDLRFPDLGRLVLSICFYLPGDLRSGHKHWWNFILKLSKGITIGKLQEMCFFWIILKKKTTSHVKL